MTLIPRIIDGLKSADAKDIAVMAGGIISKEDTEELKKIGVAAVHGPGTPLASIVESIKTILSRE